jgi:hypothetical protein
MNIAEHPQALELSKRIASSDEKCIPVMMILPVQGSITGSLRESGTPGLFILTANVQIQGTNETGLMDFTLTADKPISVGFPSLTEKESKNRIIQ